MGSESPTRGGRPPARLAAVTHAVIGIDVGGTRTKGVALTPTGEVLAEDTRPSETVDTAMRLGAAVGAQIERLTRQIDRPVAHAGVVVPGLVDEARDTGVWSANLGWRNLDLRAALAPHLSVPFSIGHDVRAGLLGEHRLGAARGHDDVCFVPLGTGLAAAVLSGGRVVRGGAWSGEIGHVVIDPDGEACGCGQRGCVETVVGGAAIARRWRRESGQDGDAAEVARLAAIGNPLATDIWLTMVDILATVLAPVLMTNGTDLLLVGGGLSRAGDDLMAPLSDRLRARLGQHEVTVSTASLGERAGALGAGVLALDEVAPA